MTNLLRFRLAGDITVMSFMVYAAGMTLATSCCFYVTQRLNQYNAFNLDPMLIESIDFSPPPSGPGNEKHSSLIDKSLTVADHAVVLAITDALRTAVRVSKEDAGLNQIRSGCSMLVRSGKNRYYYVLSLSRNNCVARLKRQYYIVDEMKGFLGELHLKQQMEPSDAG